MVLLGRRAERVIAQINSTAETLRHELMADIPISDLQTCMKVLASIRDRADKDDRLRVRMVRGCRRVGWLGTTARLNVEIRFQEKGQFARGPNES